ncbi:MAG: CAP domain-containing protein [Fimbriimonadaceae bacterium]|nr:CAP domain-containing protein [Fimbriimonadaceae bacterium]
MRAWWLLFWLAGGALAQTPEAMLLQPRWADQTFHGVEEVEELLRRFTNTERRKAELPELAVLPELVKAARQHSQEMLREDYFSHTSPHEQWATVSQRVVCAGQWEGQAGENIVYAKMSGGTLANDDLAQRFMYGAHGWMNSPGHKANILSGDYSHIGLGVAAAGGRYYATQVFARPYYDFGPVTLRRVGNQLELAGSARLLAETSRVHLAVGGELRESIAVTRGEVFRFKTLLPAGGERVKIGLHPEKDARSYWIRWVFYLDPRQPLEQVAIDPFD